MAHLVFFSFFGIYSLFQPIAVNGLNVVSSANSFIVYVDDIPLFNHSAQSPLAAVGMGTANFTGNQGNFLIEETVDEKIELPRFILELSSLPQAFAVTLSSEAYRDVSISVRIEENPSELFRTVVRVDITTAASGRNRLWFRLASDESERIFGGGEQFTYFNLKGHDFPMWTREQGLTLVYNLYATDRLQKKSVGRNCSDSLTAVVEATSPGAGGDYHTTYYPMPVFVSDRNYFVQGLQERYSVMGFSDPTRNEFYVHDQHLSLNIGTADDLLKLVGGINRASSSIPPTLPEWVYNGAIVAAQGGTQSMLDKIQMCLDQGVNISAIWIQDWAGKIQTPFGYRVFWNWRWNETLYPDLDVIVADLSHRGIQVTVYINPHLNSEGNLFQQAETLGYLLKDGRNRAYQQDFGDFLAGTIDFSNPLARQWYSDLIQENIVRLGFKGFMADFGEYTPLDAVALNSADPNQFHNQFPTLWASTVRNALEQSGSLSSVLPWARSGYTGAAKFHSIVWAGDQNVDWSKSDGLPSSIVAALSLGLSGYGLSHSDIGGYTTLNLVLTRSQELLLRWAEYSAFTPLMRTHEGNKPDLNHQVYTTNETLQAFGRLTKIYSSLAPYHKEVVQILSTSGLPAMRPLFLHYPHDLDTFDIRYQYLYGQDLLVAPVLEPEVSNWMVYLPSDDWIHLWDDDQIVINGPLKLSVHSEVGKTPVFYRAASKWSSLFGKIGRSFNF